MKNIVNEIQTGITTGSLVGAVWIMRELLPVIFRKMKNGGNSKKNTFCPGHINMVENVTANKTNISNIHHKLDEVLYAIRDIQRNINRNNG